MESNVVRLRDPIQPASTSSWRVGLTTFSHRTARCLDIIDVTDHVEYAVRAALVREGMALVQSLHTTAAVVVNEHEPLLLEDLRRTLDHVAPRDATYRHDDFDVRTENMTPDEQPNGHAHCKGLFVPTSVTLVVAAGTLLLGRWQRVFLVELDRARDRTVAVRAMGLR